MASWASPAPLAISITSTTLPWGTPSSAWMTTSVDGFFATVSASAFFSSSTVTTSPASTSRPSARTATERSVVAGVTSAALPLGRLTLRPALAAPWPWLTMTELVTMKIISSTRKMSVKGVMLMSAKTASASSPSVPGTFPIAMALCPLARLGGHGRSRRLGLERHGNGGPLAQRLDKFLSQEPYLNADAADARLEVVVEHHRQHRHQ